MQAVVYDPETGRIIQVVRGSAAAIAAGRQPTLEVPPGTPDDIDSTHIVIEGKLVERPA